MATNYPTYAQPQQTYSNNLRTAGQQQSYTQPRTNPYGVTQTQQNAWQPNSLSTYTQPRTSQYASQQPTYTTDMGRGGAMPIDSGAPPVYTPSPLPGETPVYREGQTYYNPTYPQYQPGPPAQQATPNTFSYYQGLDPATLQSNDEREAALQAVQANVPIWQLGQNAYQYAQDYNEANRRWQSQFDYQQGLDQFNMGLSAQQQQMAEWQAQQAAQQWAADFQRQTGNDQWQQDFSQQQFGLQDYATREGLNQQAAAQQWQQQYQTGQLNQGNRQLDIQQQLGLGNLDIQRQAQSIDQMYRQGQLDLGQRNAALAELTQQQQASHQAAALGAQMQEQMRRFGLDVETQTQLAAYRNAQLAQEAQLAQQQMAAQREMALLQAYGRNQAPNARWMRSA